MQPRQLHKLVTYFLNKELQPCNCPYFYCRQVQKVYFSFQSIHEDSYGFHGLSNSHKQQRPYIVLVHAWLLMMPKKSQVSHTIFAHSKQHLHNKKGRPNREHRCGAGQIPSESQVRTSHNSRVLERGKLCVPRFVRVLGLLQQQRVDLSSLDQKSFPYRSLLGHIWQNPFEYYQMWRARHFVIYAIVGGKQSCIKVVSLPYPFSLNAVSFLMASTLGYALRSASSQISLR